jgi:hypothetical protein
MTVLEKEIGSATTRKMPAFQREPLGGAFFWLCAFYLIYCARPEDWIPGLAYIPLVKISGICALLALVASAGKSKRGLQHLPMEAKVLFGMVGLLFVSAALSPVWRGGAFFKTLDFAKVPVAWVLTFLAITNFERLRRIIFIQSGSVALITAVSVVKGRSHPRLEGVIGGIYSNPNDLAFAIVLSLPFCFAFLLSTRSIPRKIAWAVAMLVMCLGLFMTASRAGFIDLVATGAVCLWYFGVKGKRYHLVAAALLVALVFGVALGGKLKDRFFAISEENVHSSLDVSAHGSYEQRERLMIESVKAVLHYPLGLGVGNFVSYNGMWREVHVAYLQIAAEGGVGCFILYLLFFGYGFANLRKLRKMNLQDPQVVLFTGALYATLVGFVVGALFAPEAYQYFPYFAVAYTSVLLAIAQEKHWSENSETTSTRVFDPRRRTSPRVDRFAPGSRSLGKPSKTPQLFSDQR